MKKVSNCLRSYFVVLLCCLLIVAVPADMAQAKASGESVTYAKTAATKKTKKTVTLTKKAYKQAKGWWTDASSGGYDRKFTKTKMKVYDRSTGKKIYVSKYYGCKKTKAGYLIKLKYKDYKFCYIINTADKVMEYYGNWNGNSNGYSGSSSLLKERW